MCMRTSPISAHCGSAIVILIVLCFASLSLPLSIAQAATGRAEPRVTLSLLPTDAETVMPGDMVQLDVRIDNIGQREALKLGVGFTYRPELTLVQESSVDEVDNREFFVYFGSQGVGTFNTRRVTLIVRPEVQPPAQVSVEAQIFWSDAHGSYSVPGPSVQLTIGREVDGGQVAASAVDSHPPISTISCMRFDGSGVVVGWAGEDSSNGAQRYRVQVRQLPNGYWSSWRVTPEPQAWFGPLEGKAFAFRVQAVDAWGNIGGWSKEISTEMLRSGAIPVCL